MRGLAKIATWNHALVGLTVLGSSAAGLAGVFTRQWTEVFDAKTVVVQPAGTDGLKITEYVDMNFGVAKDKHGYQRTIPNDFGTPTDITASSPDAPADLDVVTFRNDTRVRLGSANVNVTGQHRYVLDYTLPEARLSSIGLALDVIGTDDTMPTKRFEVIITGLELDNPQCSAGGTGTTGGCRLLPTTIGGQPAYRAVLEPLSARHGITVRGRVLGRTTPASVPVPALAERERIIRPDIAALMLALGGGTAALVYFLARNAGKNEVAGAAAADAAYGGASPFDRLPPPSGWSEARSAWLPPELTDHAATEPPRRGPVHKVTDAQLARMATVEFVPPRGIEPWEGQAILAERHDNATVGAWFSGLAARDVVDISNESGKTVITLGPQAGSLRGAEASALAAAFGDRDQITLGKYDARFAGAWRQVASLQRQRLASSGYWNSFGPSGLGGAAGATALASIGVLVLALGALGYLAVKLQMTSWLGAAVVAIVAGGIAAALMYRVLLPARSVVGSALALRTESFRRFLHASEGKHVQWAWNNGLLREYSAWAVALGEADAWSQAMAASGVVPPEEMHRGPMVVYYGGPSFTQTTTKPSSSGGGGGGGFGGGFSGSVGGGGGGGSSGSW